jgi:membrane protease YdiL (CAAX protease family)
MRILREEVGAQKGLFLPLFVSSILFLAGAFISAEYEQYPYLLFIACAISAIGIFRCLGKTALLVFIASCAIYAFLFPVEHISTLCLHAAFLSLALYFIWGQRKKLIKGCGSPLKRVGWGIGLFMLMVVASITANVLLYFSGIYDQARIVEVVSALPLYLIIFSVTIAPISEELFFRAFLTPRLGIFPSSILFALIHAAYGSIAELTGAFFLGLVLATAYSRLKDPLPCIIAHALFNALSVSIMFWVYG